MRIDVWYHPTKFRLNRIRTVGCESIWRFQEARTYGAPPRGVGESDTERFADWVLAQSLNRRTRFQLNRIRTVGSESIWKFQEARPHSASWEEIAKSETERLCAPMSFIILQSFNLVGHVILEELIIEDFKRRAPTAPLGGNRKIRDWATLRTNV